MKNTIFAVITFMLISCKATDIEKHCSLKKEVFRKVLFSKKIRKHLRPESYCYPFLLKNGNCEFDNRYFYSVDSSEIRILPEEPYSYFVTVYQYSKENGVFPRNYNFIEEIEYTQKEDTISIEWFYHYGNMNIHAKLVRKDNNLEVINAGFYWVN